MKEVDGEFGQNFLSDKVAKKEIGKTNLEISADKKKANASSKEKNFFKQEYIVERNINASQIKIKKLELIVEQRFKDNVHDKDDLLAVLQKVPFINKYRCTYVGSDEVEERIRADMLFIRSYISNHFHKDDIYALILGGSYGLGEGGISVEHGTEKSFNDYDIFVFINERLFLNHYRVKSFFQKASKILTRKLEIKVDFSCAFPKNFLSRTPLALRWYDLQEGHKVILGPADALAKFRHIDAKSLPIQEAFQLMLNRGMGLLEVKRQIQNKSFKKVEVVKNIYKAILGMGDSFLLINGHYCSQIIHRYNILRYYAKESLFISRILPFYEKAIRFRFVPVVRDEDDCSILLEDAVSFFELFYLPLFSLYYGKEIKNYRNLYKEINHAPIIDYRGHSKIKNILLNIFYFGFNNFFPNWIGSYPANRLFVLLPFFLFDENDENDEKFYLNCVNDLLNINEGEYRKEQLEKVRYERFRSIWLRFN